MALTPSAMIPLGSPMPQFSLSDACGNRVNSEDYADKPLLVMFICNHCPYVKHIAGELAEFSQNYMAAGLGVLAINSNDFVTYPEDSPENMRIEIAGRGYPFEYLVDESQEVARAFDATCTPDFFLFDSAGKLVYRGQFDDSRPGNNAPVNGKDIRAAADAILAGQQPTNDQAPSVGCNIKWR